MEPLHDIATLDCEVRIKTRLLSRRWQKVSLKLVQNKKENFLRLLVVAQASQRLLKNIALSSELLKLSGVFQQQSQSLAEWGEKKERHFVRLVKLQGINESTGHAREYQGRKLYSRFNAMPAIGPSASRDIQRCRTVLKIASENAVELTEFAEQLDFYLDSVEESRAWRRRSASTVGSLEEDDSLKGLEEMAISVVATGETS